MIAAERTPSAEERTLAPGERILVPETRTEASIHDPGETMQMRIARRPRAATRPFLHHSGGG